MVQQILADGVAQGCLYALFASSLTLRYQVARFYDFTHAAWIAAGAYLSYWLGLHFHGPILVIFILGAFGAGAVACLIDLSIFRKLRNQRASALTMMLASIGAYTIAQNVISIAASDDVKNLGSSDIAPSRVFFGARVGDGQLLAIIVCPIVIITLVLLLQRTRIGLLIKGVSVDPELARIDAIPAEKLIILCGLVSGFVSGLGGILVAYDSGAVPTFGLNLFMMGVIATVICNAKSIVATAVIGLLIGLLQNAFGWWLGGQWQDAIAFATMACLIVLGSFQINPRKWKIARS